MENSHDYKDRIYNVLPYDPNWSLKFEDEARILHQILGDEIIIEHVGSTSVPDMEAKPCIDILVIIRSLEVVKQHIEDMEKAGYDYAGAFVMKDTLLFRRMTKNSMEANIHFFPEGHPEILKMLMVRNYLRNNLEEVGKYSQYKKSLYEKYPQDYASYRKEKDTYMESLKARARASFVF